MAVADAGPRREATPMTVLDVDERLMRLCLTIASCHAHETEGEEDALRKAWVAVDRLLDVRLAIRKAERL